MRILHGLVWVLVGLGIAYWKFSRMKKGLDSKNWQAVPARVLISKYSESTSMMSATSTTMPETTINWEFQYEYQCRAKGNTGGNIVFGGFPGHYKGGYSSFIEKNPPGTDITVYMNPRDPTESVVIPGYIGDKGLRLFILAGTFGFVGLILIVLAILEG